MPADPTDLDALMAEAMKDLIVRGAYTENGLRRNIAEQVERLRQEKHWSVRKLAAEMKTSKTQVMRLLHKEIGGGLTLRTLVHAADVLGAKLEVRFTP